MAKIRFTRIDEIHRGVHSRLTDADICLFLYEKTAGKDYSFSETNQLIANLKKRPSTRGSSQWAYKAPAIKRCADDIRGALSETDLTRLTFVPIPPSKEKADLEYDDRMLQVCKAISPDADVRELVIQTGSTRASHESDGNRVTVEELLGVYEINTACIEPPVDVIAIVDDVLTAGTHFRAMKTKLAEQYPGAQIIGLFIARRIYLDDPGEPEAAP